MAEGMTSYGQRVQNVARQGASNLKTNGQNALTAVTALGATPTNSAGLVDLSHQAAARAGGLLGANGQYIDDYAAAQRRQSGISQGLDAVIAGTSPSVAQAQLAQGTAQIQQQQLAQASGATGQNAAIARVTGMQDTGQAQAEAQQHAALIRATEIQTARQQQAQIAAAQAAEAGGMYGTNVSGATGMTNAAAVAASAERSAQQKEDEAHKAFWSNLIKSGGTALASA